MFPSHKLENPFVSPEQLTNLPGPHKQSVIWQKLHFSSLHLGLEKWPDDSPVAAGSQGFLQPGPVYYPTQLFPGVLRGHVGLGQDSEKEGADLSLHTEGGWGKEGWRGRSPAHLPALGREPRVAG